MKKVYCGRCKFLSYDVCCNDLCIAPQNYSHSESDYKTETKVYKEFPKKLNKNNDCKWYEVK